MRTYRTEEERRKAEIKEKIKQAEQIKEGITSLMRKTGARAKGINYHIRVFYIPNSSKLKAIKIATTQLREIEKDLIKANIEYMPFLQH
jgi:DNA-directed RNA polymerase subunit K/omega